MVLCKSMCILLISVSKCFTYHFVTDFAAFFVTLFKFLVHACMQRSREIQLLLIKMIVIEFGCESRDWLVPVIFEAVSFISVHLN